PLILEPEVALLGQLRDGVALEDFRPGTAGRRLPCNRPYPALAKLRSRSVIAGPPGAGPAIETLGLIGGQQRPTAPYWDIMFQQRSLDGAQGPPAARGTLVELDFLLADRLFGLAHATSNILKK